eukprot:SAG11_NODE_30128_length_304_cov_0.482927_1_plen_71_part_01
MPALRADTVAQLLSDRATRATTLDALEQHAGGAFSVDGAVAVSPGEERGSLDSGWYFWVDIFAVCQHWRTS